MTEKNYEDIEQNFWNPEKINDFVAGILISSDDNVGKHKSIVYNLKQENGEVISVWGCAVLDGKMKLIEFGEDIKIIYLGKPTGKEYKDYKIQKVKA